MSDLRHVRGIDELERTLTALPQKMAATILVTATSDGAKVLQDEISARAPVRSDGRQKSLGKLSLKARLPGFLKANIGRRRAPADSSTSVKYVVGVLRSAFYAVFDEYGTRHQAARPFVRPAVESTADRVVAKMGDSLQHGLDRAGSDLGLK